MVAGRHQQRRRQPMQPVSGGAEFDGQTVQGQVTRHDRQIGTNSGDLFNHGLDRALVLAAKVNVAEMGDADRQRAASGCSVGGARTLKAAGLNSNLAP